MKRAILFDLDGTLLDTLTDLMESVNYACRAFSYPEHSYEAIRSFVGNGVKKLVERAMPEGEQARFECVYETFKAHYEQHMEDKTAPYEGIVFLLERLKAQGYLLAVVSNKFDSGVKALVEKYFPSLIDVAVGESALVRAKPAPDACFVAMDALGVSAEECLYVGDSDVDIETARASCIESISVGWGFKDADVLLEAGANKLVFSPEELYALIELM